MAVTAVIPQLRTTNMAQTIRFYTEVLGGTLEFKVQDFYAGIRLGPDLIHLKLSDEPDPSIAFVRDEEHFHLYLQTDDITATAESLKRSGARLVRDVCETEWRTRELILEDDQGHTIYFGQPL